MFKGAWRTVAQVEDARKLVQGPQVSRCTPPSDSDLLSLPGCCLTSQGCSEGAGPHPHIQILVNKCIIRLLNPWRSGTLWMRLQSNKQGSGTFFYVDLCF